MAMAVLPVPGWPAMSTARPAILPSCREGDYILHVRVCAGEGVHVKVCMRGCAGEGVHLYSYLHHLKNNSSCSPRCQLAHHALGDLHSHTITVTPSPSHHHHHCHHPPLTGLGSRASSNPSPRMCECAPAAVRERAVRSGDDGTEATSNASAALTDPLDPGNVTDLLNLRHSSLQVIPHTPSAQPIPLPAPLPARTHRCHGSSVPAGRLR